MQIGTRLMTVEEFWQLNLPDDKVYELVDGEVVEMSRPKLRHNSLQHRIAELLAPVAASYGRVRIEFPFRPTPEFNLWGADVAFVSRNRFDASDPDDALRCSPDMVIEVESPSNTAAQLDDRETRCLATGCKEFWIVYPKRKVVRVATGETVKRYQPGDNIPLSLFPGHNIAVSDIFEGV
ncbi:MAG TPA: Uma2 family endonuclease [Bryobacteraceae bacterium]|nr:Uma2 family endonuclease [Bryobacteraceae bacterium]